MEKGHGAEVGGVKLALAAAALQDHIIRSNPNLQGLCFHGPHRVQRPKFRRTHTEHTQGDEREHVLDPTPPPLTLAQRLGLVAAPRRLTAAEWTDINSRSLQEGDSVHPCVICKEKFCLQPQVLLSCSHVFHKTCLRAFERFSGRKCCPMCRREQYETREIHDGARLYREKCALRIQACWRGYIARKWYENVRKQRPPNDTRLRRQFLEAKVHELTEKLLRAFGPADVDGFLRDIDRNLAESREVFRRLDARLASVCENVCEMDAGAWLQAQEKAVQRDVQDCPICLTPLRVSHANRPLLLLSCSHLFHTPCLQTFEHFCLDGEPKCPLCRCPYTTKPV
ncbi:RING finger protein 32 [Brachyhypopomus gauderio]|uniref:RING finger protein 32 n=1 Tax=Brachyhypopomus gauderio TaxID=698409 RepID=UPI004042EE09